jgi:hypothetical protein
VTEQTTEQTEPLYDPADYTVAEVQDYLNGVDAQEFARVQEAEANGKNRVGITGYAPSVEDLKPSDDGYTRVPVPESVAYAPGPPIEDEPEDTDDTEV